MRLRVFARTGLIYGDNVKVFTCIKMVAFRTDPRFYFSGMEVFHAHWEVLVRLVSWTGKMSLADFYRRICHLEMPKTTEKVIIDFCSKTDVVAASDARSIFGSLSATPSCRAVYLAHSGQEGFDMILIERKVDGGHVAIFVDTKSLHPSAATYLEKSVLKQKWDLCLSWRQSSQATKALELAPDDCFLVIVSWRNVAAKIRDELLLDQGSRIVLLDHYQLTSLYTPTLVSRLHLITGNKLALVENAASNS
jgi:hypothetical protein